MIRYYQFTSLRLKESWLAPAYVGVDDAGRIQYLSSKAPAQAVAIEHIDGHVLPGFQNAHSHAFQFAMAGFAETHEAGARDDFWSWREKMYLCALSLDPDQMQAVATMLYAEMLRRGYTHVAEFHYVHHDKNGKPYDNVAEMGERLLIAAQEAGIKITLIPVFYQKGGLGKDPQPRQRRFISTTEDDYLKLLDASSKVVSRFPGSLLGASVHSIRAVDPQDILKTFEQAPKAIPFHLHAAEQLQEVRDCVEVLKQRPVEWLLNNLPLNERFHLVHCTHMNDEEVTRLAKSKAHVVLCPGTEGNLGDGIFRLTDYAAAQGKWSIGTDSHISLNPLEDLRWLDYAQRLVTHKRNTFDDGASLLLNETFFSGKSAMGLAAGDTFEIGHPFDGVVFDASAPSLSHQSWPHLLSSILYTADSGSIIGTIVNGRWVVRNQRHENTQRFREAYRRVMRTIYNTNL